MSNARKNVKKSDPTLRNTADSINNFNMIMNKKLEELKAYIISELT